MSDLDHPMRLDDPMRNVLRFPDPDAGVAPDDKAARPASDEAPASQTPGAAIERSARQERLRQGLTVGALSLLILVLVYVILRELTAILRPLLVAVFLCYLIIPAHHWLVRRKLPSVLAYVAIVALVVAVAYVFAQITIPSVTAFSKALPAAAGTLESYIQERLEWIDRSLGPWLNLPEPGAATQPAESAPTAPARRPPVIPALLSPWLTSAGQAMLGVFTDFFTAALIVTFYSIFLLAEAASFQRRLESAFGSDGARRGMAAIAQINVAISRYISTKTFVSVLIGGITGLTLYLFQFPYYGALAVITFFANFVPYIGSFFAVALALAMSFVHFEELTRPAVIAGLLFAAQQITGSYLEPKLVGQQLGVSPLMILLSLAFWGYLWGVPGMILSSPLIVTVKIALEHLEGTRPVAALMSKI